MQYGWIVRFVLLLTLASGLNGASAREVTVETEADVADGAGGADGFLWQSEYGEAMAAAERYGQMLVVVFVDRLSESDGAWVDRIFAAERLQPLLENVTAVKLPLDAVVQIGGEAVKLMEHDAFGELAGRAGLAMIDLRKEGSPHYRQVVSIFPFHAERVFDETQLHVLLTLPEGSLTQRTLVYAVRTHQEKPQSAASRWNGVLASEAQSHSVHQAQIGVQGHHQWETRFHRINARMPRGELATEVCAESWPRQGLFAGAIECVRSWRQSPGHWNAVSRRHGFFGYDMKRGRNGVWYATGIFAGG